MIHRIGKIAIDMHAPRSADGFALQTEVKEWFWQELMPELSRAFDAALPSDMVLKIDRLDIEVPKVPLTQWRDKMTPSVCRAIIEEITRRRLFPKPTDKPIVAMTLRENGFAAWLFFIKTGQKPLAIGDFSTWQMAALAAVASSESDLVQLKKALNSEHALERLIRQHDTLFLTQLIAAMTGQSADILRGWLYAFSGLIRMQEFRWVIDLPVLDNRTAELIFWQIIFEKIKKVEQKIDIQAFITLDFLCLGLEKMLNKPFLIKDLTAQFLVFFQKKIINISLGKQNTEGGILGNKKEEPNRFKAGNKGIRVGIDTVSALAFIQNESSILFKNVPEKERWMALFEPFFEKIAVVIPQSVQAEIDSRSAFLKNEKEQNPLSLSPSKKEKLKDDLGAPKQPFTEGSDEEKHHETLDFELKAKGNKEKIDTRKQHLSEGESLYVSMAGVVMLHPFITPFFRTLQLVEGADFKDEVSRRRGVGLLQYLAVGDLDVVEFDATLLKWLCGLPFDVPIDSRLDLTETERQEADDLLETVIAHWGALGSVGADSLREGFLQRDGKLTKRSDGWLLQIEKQTLDILLDKLPWGLGIIKLPWQTDILFVEW